MLEVMEQEFISSPKVLKNKLTDKKNCTFLFFVEVRLNNDFF